MDLQGSDVQWDDLSVKARLLKHNFRAKGFD